MYEFDKCDVFDVYGNSLASGFIKSFDNGVLEARLDRNKGILEGQTVRLIVLDPVRGECRFEARALDENISSGLFGNLTFLGSLQKRNNARVNVHIDVRVVSHFRGEFEEKLPQPITITILNISAQGLYFTCNEKLRTGFTFPMDFYQTKRPLRLRVRIVRLEEYAKSCNYGCVLDIPEKDMDELYRFVLKEQIRQLKKERK